MGLAARLSDLCLDIVDLTANHRSEIADLVLRSFLDNFILGSWLIHKRDASLYERFIDFGAGKDKFMSEGVIERAESLGEVNKALIAKMKEFAENSIKESGLNDFEVASERGDAFETNTATMAEEVWGKNNIQYFFYKRVSETTHGGWRVIKKYHLDKSLNPLHNGLLLYSHDLNKINGLHTVFMSIMYASEYLLDVLNDTQDGPDSPDSGVIKNLQRELDVFYRDVIKASQEYNMVHALGLGNNTSV